MFNGNAIRPDVFYQNLLLKEGETSLHNIKLMENGRSALIKFVAKYECQTHTLVTLVWIMLEWNCLTIKITLHSYSLL